MDIQRSTRCKNWILPGCQQFKLSRPKTTSFGLTCWTMEILGNTEEEDDEDEEIWWWGRSWLFNAEAFLFLEGLPRPCCCWSWKSSWLFFFDWFIVFVRWMALIAWPASTPSEGGTGEEGNFLALPWKSRRLLAIWGRRSLLVRFLITTRVIDQYLFIGCLPVSFCLCDGGWSRFCWWEPCVQYRSTTGTDCCQFSFSSAAEAWKSNDSQCHSIDQEQMFFLILNNGYRNKEGRRLPWDVVDCVGSFETFCALYHQLHFRFDCGYGFLFHLRCCRGLPLVFESKGEIVCFDGCTCQRF